MTFTHGLDINVHDQWRSEKPGPHPGPHREHLRTTDKRIVLTAHVLVAIGQSPNGEKPDVLDPAPRRHDPRSDRRSTAWLADPGLAVLLERLELGRRTRIELAQPCPRPGRLAPCTRREGGLWTDDRQAAAPS